MKVLHISTSDLDGGAARAAYRLNQGLTDAGVTSKMLVRAKTSNDPSVISYRPLISRLGSKIDGWPLKVYKTRQQEIFSPQWFPDTIASKVNEIDPDIIHLHWTCNGFLRIETLGKFQKPLVWTLHDMWGFTGGCHYTKDCDRYKQDCGECPQLNSREKKDLSLRVWQRKARSWYNLNLTIVTPSRWLAQCVKDSSLLSHFPVKVIPNGINTELYRPIEKSTARKYFNLPQKKLLILFGSGSTKGESRKGFDYLISSLQKIYSDDWKDKLELVVFGSSETKEHLPINFKVHYLGKLQGEDILAKAYSAANVYIAPSKQDNLPNTVIESLACGTPCIAFDIGGMPDMIKHKYNGFLVQPFDINELVQGITWILQERERLDRLSKNSRQHVLNNFTLSQQVEKFISVYHQPLKHV